MACDSDQNQCNSQAASNMSASSGSWIFSLLTSKFFIVYCLVNYGWVYYAYTNTIKSFGTRKSLQDVQLDHKYKAFKRNDIDKIEKIWIFTMIMSPTLLIRALIGYAPYFLMLFVSLLASNFDDMNLKIKDRFSYNLNRMMVKYTARFDLMIMGCWPGMFTVEQVDVDYKKYLGPDWQLNKSKVPTTIIANH